MLHRLCWRTPNSRISFGLPLNYSRFSPVLKKEDLNLRLMFATGRIARSPLRCPLGMWRRWYPELTVNRNSFVFNSEDALDDLVARDGPFTAKACVTSILLGAQDQIQEGTPAPRPFKAKNNGSPSVNHPYPMTQSDGSIRYLKATPHMGRCWIVEESKLELRMLLNRTMLSGNGLGRRFDGVGCASATEREIVCV
ncbi:hypothetical protein K469DRAFT_784351 [Zopfia rhizophila CBS 207.26]|uniref:Uncharacterized protein n=1 Tax=Zopfia rhizophila CBS 207.26 TaxID=1314779 RepID=A0A6A6E133_9PEZI|nr:hypothetical protein K469DRAFT_784351 [Zopfia rhizophila CBS 207.26]